MEQAHAHVKATEDACEILGKDAVEHIQANIQDMSAWTTWYDFRVQMYAGEHDEAWFNAMLSEALSKRLEDIVPIANPLFESH